MVWLSSSKNSSLMRFYEFHMYVGKIASQQWLAECWHIASCRLSRNLGLSLGQTDRSAARPRAQTQSMYVRRRMKQCLYLYQQILQCFASLQMQLQSPHLFTACALIMTKPVCPLMRLAICCASFIHCQHINFALPDLSFSVMFELGIVFGQAASCKSGRGWTSCCIRCHRSKKVSHPQKWPRHLYEVGVPEQREMRPLNNHYDSGGETLGL